MQILTFSLLLTGKIEFNSHCILQYLPNALKPLKPCQHIYLLWPEGFKALFFPYWRKSDVIGWNFKVFLCTLWIPCWRASDAIGWFLQSHPLDSIKPTLNKSIFYVSIVECRTYKFREPHFLFELLYTDRLFNCMFLHLHFYNTISKSDLAK